jgi:hypothetical protein
MQNQMTENDPLAIIDLNKIDITFNDKPIVIGGMAMEYYGLRKHGDDIDFIVSNCDYLKLETRYRNYRKDIWGDFGVKVNGYDMFRSIWKLDYNYYNNGSKEFDQYKIVSIDILFRMQVFALGSDINVYKDKHKDDLELLKNYFLKTYQNEEWVDYMDKNSDRYIKAENGLIINGDYY